jgi:hypothetical protein
MVWLVSFLLAIPGGTEGVQKSQGVSGVAGDSDSSLAPIELGPEEVSSLVDDWMLGLLGLECAAPGTSES